MYWLSFVVMIVLMYVCINTVGQLTGGSHSSWLASVRQLFSPVVLGLVLVTNVLFAIGIYFGFIVSNNALTIAISIGIVTSYVYSVVVTGVGVTVLHLFGLLCVLVGVYFLR